MGKIFISGLLVIVAGFIAILLDSLVGLGLGSVLLGIAVGGILGLSSDGSPIGRLGAFVVGFVVALVGYLVRILFLNDSVAGQMLYILLVVGLVTLVSALTRNRLPFVAGLLGVVAVVGAYEFAFVSAPQNVQTELFEYSARVLVPVALGYLLALFAPIGDDNPPASQPMNPGNVSLQKSEV